MRGAAQAEANEAEAILAATEELMRELIERNELEPEAMVSCLFTTTDDLDAEFPAVAARKLGLDSVPLLCAREIHVPGAMERVIRVMVHYYAPVGHAPAHAYLGRDPGAALRPPRRPVERAIGHNRPMTVTFAEKLARMPGLPGRRADRAGARGDRRRRASPSSPPTSRRSRPTRR